MLGTVHYYIPTIAENFGYKLCISYTHSHTEDIYTITLSVEDGSKTSHFHMQNVFVEQIFETLHFDLVRFPTDVHHSISLSQNTQTQTYAAPAIGGKHRHGCQTKRHTRSLPFQTQRAERKKNNRIQHVTFTQTHILSYINQNEEAATSFTFYRKKVNSRFMSLVKL